MKLTVKEKAFAVQAFVRTGSASHTVIELSKGSRNQDPIVKVMHYRKNCNWKTGNKNSKVMDR